MSISSAIAPTPFDVVDWMRRHGIPGYALKIYRLQRTIALALTHNHRGVAAARRRVAVLETHIEDIRREAYERYDDWRTDPLDEHGRYLAKPQLIIADTSQFKIALSSTVIVKYRKEIP